MSNDFFALVARRRHNFAASNKNYLNMKARFILTLVALIVTATAAEAKIVRRQLGILQTEVPASKVIAPGNLEFTYEYIFNADTVSDPQRATEKMLLDKEKMLLQVSANGISKFTSLKNAQVDSIIPTMSQEDLIRNAERLANGPFVNIFKNYPEGQLTHTEKIVLDWFRYREPLPDFKWELGDSTRNILGYECLEAKCTFRGREWTVYYTEEIPIMDGPWKFCGLPGLIMSASEKDGTYSYECIGIKNNASRSITIYDVPYNETTRKKFYDTLHRYETNPYGYAETVAGFHITVTDQAGNPDPTAYDPIELSYDFIERDWNEK